MRARGRHTRADIARTVTRERVPHGGLQARGLIAAARGVPAFQPWQILASQLLQTTAEITVGRRRVQSQRLHGGGTHVDQRCAVATQLLVPEIEFIRAGLARLDPLKQRVPLRHDFPVTLQRLCVGRIDLAEHDVQVAPPHRWRTTDQLHVVGREEHGHQLPDHVRLALGDAVHAQPLGGRHARPVRRLGPAHQNDLQLQRALVTLHVRGHASDWLRLVQRVPVDQAAIGQHAVGAGGGEKKGRLQQVALTLGVVAQDERASPRQLQFKRFIVAEVREC